MLGTSNRFQSYSLCRLLRRLPRFAGQSSAANTPSLTVGLLTCFADYIDSLGNHPLQNRKPLQPLCRLLHNQESRPNMLFVKCSASANSSLIRKRADGFQSALNRHQTEFLNKIVRVDCRKALLPSLFKKKQTMCTHLSQ